MSLFDELYELTPLAAPAHCNTAALPTPLELAWGPFQPALDTPIRAPAAITQPPSSVSVAASVCEAAPVHIAAVRATQPPAAWESTIIKLGKMAIKAVAIVREKGGTMCGMPVKDGNKKFAIVKCQRGHVWNACLAHIIHQGSWCPTCRMMERRSPTEKWTQKTGIVPLDAYVPGREKRRWRCPRGHVFEATFRHLRNRQTGYCRLCK